MNATTLLAPRGIDVTVLAEVLAGLKAPEKRLPCKLFYDEAGSALFERICLLPEYYLTRTELAILQQHGEAMAQWLGPRARIVEFGSGSGEKIRALLKHRDDVAEYIPIDISRPQLFTFTRGLIREFPNLSVRPMWGDYTGELSLPEARNEFERTVVFFPGSTIGNFEPHEAVDFMRRAAEVCGPKGGLLIGVDTRKERAVLERAYNDKSGVTAAFNLNMLTHINRICDADFNTQRFIHRAIYNAAHGRIEMYLVSSDEQVITLARSSNKPFRMLLSPGESLLTEYSYKYDVESFQSLAHAAGLEASCVWTDPLNYFSVQALNVI